MPFLYKQAVLKSPRTTSYMIKMTIALSHTTHIGITVVTLMIMGLIASSMMQLTVQADLTHNVELHKKLKGCRHFRTFGTRLILGQNISSIRENDIGTN
jgi:hypothetical protein